MPRFQLPLHAATAIPVAPVPCDLCRKTVPATHRVAVPRDCGPFTNVEESTHFQPRLADDLPPYDMPVCEMHAAEMARTVTCATCKRELPAADAIVNASGTTYLCRPCNNHENTGMPCCWICGEPQRHLTTDARHERGGLCQKCRTAHPELYDEF